MQQKDSQQPDEAAKKQSENEGAPDMHSSKDAQESQGGKGGKSSDTDTNSMHDKGNEHSIAGREDS